MERRKFLGNFIKASVSLSVAPTILVAAQNQYERPVRVDFERQMLDIVFKNAKIIENEFLKIRLLTHDKKIADYKGYEDKKIPRTYEYWDINEGTVRNNKEIMFTESKGNNVYLRYFQVLTEENDVLFEGQLASDLKMSKNASPMFMRGQLELTIE